MALKYVSDHKPIGNIAYEAVTFAAPAFVTATWPTGEPFSDDHRITQIEIANDPVPWLQAGSVNRPGQKILFSGNQTLDELDQLIKYPESVSRLPAHPIFV